MAGNGLTALRQALQFISKGPGFDVFLKNLRVVSGGAGRVVCEMTVSEEHQNRVGTLHGGMTASLVDSVSTLALMSTGAPPGVSVELSVSYLRAAAVGDEIVIDSHVLKRGSSIAFLAAEISRKTDNKVLATGKHTKFIDQ